MGYVCVAVNVSRLVFSCAVGHRESAALRQVSEGRVA
jgi:hypothetical protein